MGGEERRLRFEHDGRLVYEWEQGLDEVLVWVRPPAGVRAQEIECVVSATRVRLGLKGNPPFIDEDLWGTCEAAESLWTLDDGEIELSLKKMRKAETWEAVFKGHEAMDPMQKQEVQKKLTLQRFQEEHPGFDFSGAQFSGAAPDPRTFMDGVSYE